MGNRIHLEGKVFGNLRVLRFGEITRTPGGGAQYRWLCACSCGNELMVDGCCLRRGSAKDCGCKRGSWSKTHGMSCTKEYQTWLSMKQRCFNPSNACYSYYGGRGISVCSEWRDSFSRFYSDMGPSPGNRYTVDRINVNGNYCKENCRWATRSVQSENSRQTKWITHQGETLSRAGWSRKTGINRATLRSRLDRLGWTIERALTTPVRTMAARLERAERRMSRG